MDPQKRFGQIEEILSEMLAKQDEHTAQIKQLAKSVGQVLEVVLDAKDIATKSKGIAIESRDIAIESRSIALRVEKKTDSTANAVAKLTVDVQKGFVQVNERINGVNERFDELMSFLKEKLG